jgi:hypothetical protein
MLRGMPKSLSPNDHQLPIAEDTSVDQLRLLVMPQFRLSSRSSVLGEISDAQPQ